MMENTSKQRPPTDNASPFRQARREIQEREQRDEQKSRSEVRGTRLSEDEAAKLDQMAEKAGLSVSTLIRVICLSDDRPDKKLFAAALEEIQSLVQDFALRNLDSDPSAEEIAQLRTKVDDLCRGLT